MKKRRRQNSHSNPELVRQYRLDNLECEFCGELQDHIHHIWAGAPRVDVISNLTSLCETCHAKMHLQPIQGKIACMAIKLSKDELDKSDLNLAARQHVEGWLSSDKVQLACQDNWIFRTLRVLLLRELEVQDGIECLG